MTDALKTIIVLHDQLVEEYFIEIKAVGIDQSLFRNKFILNNKTLNSNTWLCTKNPCSLV